ncbi:hypothetical protein [Deefgea sp. CFH1-16]|uniref:hypothetical protein n=1 Tax=Deefgea sp. CFH1-16 TaxID=2675457 RepID=UPI001FFDD2CA|nr:hypothetical protein [Deefgea sp. CFH1-16]
MITAGKTAASRRRPKYAVIPKLERWRVWTVLGGLMVLFAALLGRALYLQVWNEGFLQDQGDARYRRVLKLEANRGMITDRNGEPLAISTPVQSIWMSPRSMLILPAGQQRAEDWKPANDDELMPLSLDEVKKLETHLQLKSGELLNKIDRITKKLARQRNKIRFSVGETAYLTCGCKKTDGDENPRSVFANRISPLLPGRRSDGSYCRFYRY